MTQRRPLPDSEARRKEKLARTFSRWLFWGGFTVVVLLVLAILVLA